MQRIEVYSWMHETSLGMVLAKIYYKRAYTYYEKKINIEQPQGFHKL